MWQELQARLTDQTVTTSLPWAPVSVPRNVALCLPLCVLLSVFPALALPLDVNGFFQPSSIYVDRGALILSVGFCDFFLFCWTPDWLFLGFRKNKCPEKFPYGDPNSYNSLHVSFQLSFHPLSYSELFSKNTNLVWAFPCWNVFNGFPIALRIKTKSLKWSLGCLQTSLGSSYTILPLSICVTPELPRSPFNSVLFPS